MNKFYRLYIEKIVYSFPCITVTEENHLNPDDIDSYIVSESRSVVREHETKDASIAHAKRYVEWSQKKRIQACSVGLGYQIDGCGKNHDHFYPACYRRIYRI